MKTPEFTKAATAADRMVIKANELAGRAKETRTQVMNGDVEGLIFFAEMIRESSRAVEFWLIQLEEVVSK